MDINKIIINYVGAIGLILTAGTVASFLLQVNGDIGMLATLIPPIITGLLGTVVGAVGEKIRTLKSSTDGCKWKDQFKYPYRINSR